MTPKVAILDAGSQFAKVIDRRVRELNIESEIFPLETTKEQIGKEIEAIIISGWPESVLDKSSPQIDKSILDIWIPILWICYGFQLLNKLTGWKIEKTSIREDGAENIKITKKDSLLFEWLKKEEQVLMSHGDSVKEIGKWFQITSRSSSNIISSIEDTKRKLYAVQFHPEVDITTNGTQMIENFLTKIAGIEANYTLEDRETQAINYIRSAVWKKKVLSLVSWWVDSTVLTALLYKALKKEQVISVHIDNWFMRTKESQKVKEALGKIWVDLEVIDAKETFHNATTLVNGKKTKKLCKTTNPEEKRKIIWDTFMRIKEQYCKENWLNNEDILLAQWTLRPDLIESGSGTVSSKADTIKTHHNDTQLVRELRDQWKVIEPLKDLHKDEVRKLWLSLWLPDNLIWRQPFPGPGLAIRILCTKKPFMDESFKQTNITLKHLTNFKKSPKDFQKSIQKNFPNDFIKLIHRSGKVHATLLPIKTVGTQWDARTYNYAVWLSWKTEGVDFNLFPKIIPKILHNINRVVYIHGTKISWNIQKITPTLLSDEVVEKLQKADTIVNEILYKNNLIKKLSQVPVILIPLPFWKEGNHSIVIRPFITNDFMTWVPAIPGKQIPKKIVDEIVQKILQIEWISRVIYDLTPKPPGTTEWE